MLPFLLMVKLAGCMEPQVPLGVFSSCWTADRRVVKNIHGAGGVVVGDDAAKIRVRVKTRDFGPSPSALWAAPYCSFA
jgi:hypothetical protein